MSAVRFATVAVALAVIAAPVLAGDLGDAAAPLSVAKWVKGGPVDLTAGKGKNIYVVEFWATWCPPCRVSIPHLTELQKKYKDQGVVFVGVSRKDANGESLEKVEAFTEKMGDKMDYVVGFDDDGKTYKAYMGGFGQSGIPTAFIVNKQGQVAWVGHPMADLDKALEQIIAGNYDIEKARQKQADRKKFMDLANSYMQRVTTSKEADGAAEIGNEILKLIKDDATTLNQFAWTVLTHPSIMARDLDLGMRAAKAAYVACEGKDFSIVDTYARAFYETGDLDSAIKYQKQALELAKQDKNAPEGATEDLEKTLKKYQDEAD